MSRKPTYGSAGGYCYRAFAIDNSILNLLDPDAQNEESRRELTIFGTSEPARAKGTIWYDHKYGRAELIATLAALSTSLDKMVLEFEFGDGRYTLLLVEESKLGVVVDFARKSVRTVR